MTPTKLLIGQILVVLAIVVAGIWLATQWAAAHLGFQTELGAPWAAIGGVPIYRPWVDAAVTKQAIGAPARC